MKVATCISCACDDNHACDDGLGGACSWLVVTRGRGIGVCSCCPRAIKRWDSGDRRVRGLFMLRMNGTSRLRMKGKARATWLCDSTATLQHANKTHEEQFARRYRTHGAAAGIAKKLGNRLGARFFVDETTCRT